MNSIDFQAISFTDVRRGWDNVIQRNVMVYFCDVLGGVM